MENLDVTSVNIPRLRHEYRLVMNYAYYSVGFAVAYLYHFILTMDTEVSHIWTGRRWTLGGAIYLPTRYIPLLHLGLNIAQQVMTPTYFSTKSCAILGHLQSVGQAMIVLSTDLALTFSIYILIGATKRSLILVGIVYLALCGPVAALFAIQVSRMSTDMLIPSEYRVRLAELELPCLYSTQRPSNILKALGVLYLGGALISTALAIAVFIIRSKRQSASVLRSFHRDGAGYHLAACASRFSYALLNAASLGRGFSSYLLNVHSDAFLRMHLLFGPILATNLIFHLKNATDSDTRSVVSTLIFGQREDNTSAATNNGRRI